VVKNIAENNLIFDEKMPPKSGLFGRGGVLSPNAAENKLFFYGKTLIFSNISLPEVTPFPVM
jgi:hypothetical protein